MNKSDLKNGMFVEYKDGTSRVYVDGGLWTENGMTVSINDINDDLKSSILSAFDINKIFYCGKLIWERKEIDWSKVPVGTKVLVSDNENNWYEHLFINYIHDEEFKFKAVDIKSRQIHNWKYCKLAEESKEEIEVVSIEELENKYGSFEDVNCNECRYCKYEKFNVCEFAWLLDNYNVTRKDNK